MDLAQIKLFLKLLIFGEIYLPKIHSSSHNSRNLKSGIASIPFNMQM